MKSNLIGLIAGILALTAAPGHANAADYYYGAKAGQMIPSISGLGNATSIGALMGFPVNNPSTSIEAELTTTVSDGDIDFYSSLGWNVTTLAGYFVYRTQASPYLKLKGGLLYEDVSIDGFYGYSASGTDTGLSFGAGIGWNLANGNKIEIEATVIEADINFISVSYIF